MMDIVKRLRNHSPSSYACQDCYDHVMDEAADRIEKLMTALISAQRIIERDFPSGQLATDIRNALAE